MVKFLLAGIVAALLLTPAPASAHGRRYARVGYYYPTPVVTYQYYPSPVYYYPPVTSSYYVPGPVVRSYYAAPYYGYYRRPVGYYGYYGYYTHPVRVWRYWR